MEAGLGRAAWRTSSYSGGSGNCIEVAGDLPGGVGVRDSKVPGGQALVFTTAAWRAFAGQVKSGNLCQRKPDACRAKSRVAGTLRTPQGVNRINRTISKADLTR